MKKRWVIPLIVGAALLLLLAVVVKPWNLLQVLEDDSPYLVREPLRRNRNRPWPRPVPPPAPQQVREATAAERAAVSATIKAQLEAFKKDDYEQALQYQSRLLKSNFSSAEALRATITDNYPKFTDYKSVRFGPTRAYGGGQAVDIEAIVTASDNQSANVLYSLIRENGRYFIQGVAVGLGSSRMTSTSFDPFPTRTPDAP